jgi:DNA-binding MarR family transcriptional regulator
VATTTTPTTDLERRLEEFVTVYDQEFARAASTVGLSAAQACTLGWTETQMPMSALARVLACDASNVSQIVGRLEAHGLVERTVDGDDRRVKLVRITPAGRRAYARVRAQFAFARAGLDRLDEDERRELQRLLAKLTGPEHEDRPQPAPSPAASGSPTGG